MIELESKRTNLVSSNNVSFRDSLALCEIENTILGGIKRQIPSPIKPMHLAPFYGHLFSADIHVSCMWTGETRVKLISSSLKPSV